MPQAHGTTQNSENRKAILTRRLCQEDGGFWMVSDPVLEIDTNVQNRRREVPVCFRRRCSRTLVFSRLSSATLGCLLCCSQSLLWTLKPCMDFPFLFFVVLKTERFHRQGEQKLFAEPLTCKACFSLSNSEANRA